MKRVRTSTKMKREVVAILISLAFVSQAFAVLRPLFPIKPAAPSNGELIIIGDDLVSQSAKNARYVNGIRRCSRCLGKALSLSDDGSRSVGYALTRGMPCSYKAGM